MELIRPFQGNAQLVKGSHLRNARVISTTEARGQILSRCAYRRIVRELPVDIYVGKSGLSVPQGPYSESEIIFRLRAGIIEDSSLAWVDGMEGWEPVRNVINGAMDRVLSPKKGIYTPGGSVPFRLSRSKLDNFLKCPRCFYLDRRLGIKPPSGPAFAINIAVDGLLKREFDIYRKDEVAHPLMVENGINAVPWPGLFEHEEWRDNFKGIPFLHEPTNLQLFGAVDDIWVNAQGELIVVDYKATSRAKKIKSAEDIGGWYEAYKRQLEIYVWLLRQQNGCTVSDDIYWVYANGDKKKDAFNRRVEFDLTLIAEQADDSWVEGALLEAHACLGSKTIPEPDDDCKHCQYVQEAFKVPIFTELSPDFST